MMQYINGIGFNTNLSKQPEMFNVITKNKQNNPKIYFKDVMLKHLNSVIQIS